MKILNISSSLNVGGTEAFIMNFYRNTKFNKSDFTFVSFTDGINSHEEEIFNLGGNVFKPSDIGIKLLSKFIKMINLCIYIYENNFDVIHIHGCSLLDLILGLIPSKIFCPESKIIVHSHSVGTKSKNPVKSILKNLMKVIVTRFADIRLSCSKEAGQSKYLRSSKYTIVNNGIDTVKYKFNHNNRNLLRNNLSLHNKIVIGHIGRFEHEKNQEFLINILQKLPENFVLFMIGEGSLKNRIIDKVNNMNLGERVIFSDNVINPYDFYNVFDVFVLPSKYEGQPFVLIEAQTNGLAVLISQNVPAINIITDGVQINLENENEWIENIIKFSSRRVEKIEEIYKKGFDIGSVVDQIEGIYNA